VIKRWNMPQNPYKYWICLCSYIELKEAAGIKEINQIIFALSISINIILGIVALNEMVTVSRAEYNLNEINRERTWVTDEDMARQLAEAYNCNNIQLAEQFLGCSRKTTVTFQEEEYEWRIKFSYSNGIDTFKEVICIRKDYGITLFYDRHNWDEVKLGSYE